MFRQEDRWMAEAQKALERNDYSQAESVFGRILEKDPNSFAGLVHRSLVRIRLNQLDLALEDAEKASAARPDSAIAWMVLAEVFLAKKDYPAAYEKFKKALEHEKDNGRIYFGLGLSAARLGKGLEAGDYFEQALHFEKHYALAQFMARAFAQN